jgi:hypothetical protein
MTFALMSFVMFGTAMIAIDVGRSVHDESVLQNALDAAAIAALKVDLPRRVEVGTQVFNLNMAGAQSPVNSLTFETLGNGSVKATATMSVEMLTNKITGSPPIEIPGQAIADPKALILSHDSSVGEVPCIHVMDQNINNGFDLDRNVNLDAHDCHAYTRSNDLASMRSNNSENVVFKKIRVKGSANIIGGGLQIEDEPHTIIIDAPIVGDPYNRDIDSVRQVLAAPRACTNANSNKVLTGVVPSGTYCENTEFRNATLSGLYYIVSRGASRPGKLKLSGNIQADGATIYLYDNAATLAPLHELADGSVLKAPKTGPTRGVLIMEGSNRGASSNVEFARSKGQTWEGLLYMPSSNVTFNSFEEFPLFNVAIAANRLNVRTWKNMPWNVYRWTPYTSSLPVSYDPTLLAATTTTYLERPIYLSK